MKRKKHNPKERVWKQTRIEAKRQNLVLSMVFGQDPEVVCRNIKTGNRIEIARTFALALAQTPCKWKIILMVFGVESNGKLKAVPQAIRTPPVTQGMLNGWLSNELDDMAEAQAMSVTATGWIAMPAPPEYVDELTETLLELRLKELLENPVCYKQG